MARLNIQGTVEWDFKSTATLSSTICTLIRAGHSLFISRFALRSLLISYPWIAIALALIWPIFRFAHRSIALKKPVVCSRKRALKRKIAPKTTAVRSYVCIGTYICT